MNETSVITPLKPGKLKSGCLGLLELCAQNIALISPTMTAALIIPLMYSNSGAVSWLPYALGTVMLIFVAMGLNQFAKRSSATGSMYSYVGSALGYSGGAMCGWCLVWAYTFIGLAGTTGFTIFAGKLLDMMHWSLPPVVLFAICIGACFALSYFDIKVSIIIPLILEGFSCLAILVLCFIVLSKHHFAIDHSQFDFKGSSLSTLGLGVVVAVFSLVGFESSTAFGEEASNPLKTIPKSIIWSLVAAGIFFVFVCYVEVLGTAGYKDTLDKIDAPLSVLSEMYSVPIFSPILSAGAMFSFFALALSCLNSGARIIYSMGSHQFFPSNMSTAHPVHKTPHVSLLFMAAMMYLIATVCSAGGLAVLDAFNDAGTMGAFGFLGAYTLITIAAPVFLKKRGEIKSMDIALCVVTLLLLVIPAVGSVYPVPSAPVNAFPYIFLVYLIVGFVRIRGVKEFHAERVTEISKEIHKLHNPATT